MIPLFVWSFCREIFRFRSLSVSPSLALTYFVDPQVLKEKNGPKEIVKIENKLKEKEINKVRLVCSQLIFRDRIILQ